MEISEKQRKFAEEYLTDYCAARAARRAGYSADYGKRLLKKEPVREYLRERQKEVFAKAGITAERVLEELSAVAFSNIADYTEVKKDAGAKKGVVLRTKETSAIPREKLSAVAGMKEGPGGVEVRLYEKLRALELLGKCVGLFRESDKNGGVPVVILDDIPAKQEGLSEKALENDAGPSEEEGED